MTTNWSTNRGSRTREAEEKETKPKHQPPTQAEIERQVIVKVPEYVGLPKGLKQILFKRKRYKMNEEDKYPVV